jgi:hypothetical protein
VSVTKVDGAHVQDETQLPAGIRHECANAGTVIGARRLATIASVVEVDDHAVR